MKNSLQRILLVLALAALVVGSTGCRNTAHGIGHDIENAGEKIQDKSR